MANTPRPPEQPPQRRRGLLPRRELAAMIRSLGRKLGFELQSDDFAYARDHGTGLAIHLRRPRTPFEIQLKLEVQVNIGTALQCVIAVAEGEGYAWLVKVVVEHWENGDITTTTTASGDIIVNGESSCPAADVSSDYDPEFDYGAYISTDDPTYNSANSPAEIKAAAAGALLPDGSPYYLGSWTWMSNVDPPTAGSSFNLGSWTGDEVSAEVTSYDYRWLAIGADLTVAWNQGGGAHSVDLVDGVESGWYTDSVPETEGDTDQITDIVVTLN